MLSHWQPMVPKPFWSWLARAALPPVSRDRWAQRFALTRSHVWACYRTRLSNTVRLPCSSRHKACDLVTSLYRTTYTSSLLLVVCPHWFCASFPEALDTISNTESEILIAELHTDIMICTCPMAQHATNASLTMPIFYVWKVCTGKSCTNALLSLQFLLLWRYANCWTEPCKWHRVACQLAGVPWHSTHFSSPKLIKWMFDNAALQLDFGISVSRSIEDRGSLWQQSIQSYCALWMQYLVRGTIWIACYYCIANKPLRMTSCQPMRTGCHKTSLQCISVYGNLNESLHTMEMYRRCSDFHLHH